MMSSQELKPRKLPTQRRAQLTVDAILEATGLLLKESGLEHFTCNHIAERAGISIGSLYQYFSNKEAIIAELRRRHFRMVTTRLKTAIQACQGCSFSEQLYHIVRVNVAIHQSDPALHQLLTDRYRHIGFDADTTEPREDSSLLASQPATSALVNELGFNETQARTSAIVIASIVESLTHAAIVDQRLNMEPEDLVEEIVKVVTGYLSQVLSPQVGT